MEFLKKVENFLNDKAKIVEDTINNTLNNVSNQVDINGMLDQASDKMNEMLGSINGAGTQPNNQMNNNLPQDNNTLGYTGETVKMETKQAIDLYPETVLNTEFGVQANAQENINTGNTGVNLKKNSECAEKHGVSLKK